LMCCSFCGTDEVFYRREYEGVSLCKGCFLDSVETKVRRTITKRGMLSPRDTVAVALSGGKDSVALLRILTKLERRFPLARLVGLTVDEGIVGYRDEAISTSKEVCRQLDIEHMVVSFDELYGITMDEVAKLENELQPCSYCGVLRRKALNEAARRLGASKLATAHNLDDEVQTALLNIMHGDVERIARGLPATAKTHHKFIPRIKPLVEVSERETTLYAYATGSQFQSLPCPHGDDTLRGDIRAMLNRLEQKHAGVKHTIYGSIERLSRATVLAEEQPGLRECTICGDPTPNEICEACAMLTTLRKNMAASHGAQSVQVSPSN